MEESACHCAVARPNNGRSAFHRLKGAAGCGGGGPSPSLPWPRPACGCGDDVSWLVPLVLVLCLSVMTTAAQLRPETDISIKTEEGVCQSRDIRNSVREFSQLKGCRVVEGFVQIVLIDKANESEYANISFPELQEITGYLLLYRVNGLRSLSHMFPNLAVIRGNTLFFNYALIVFEMLHLQELGLKSLTDILRGAVYINKNPMLCYVGTIDWDKIARISITSQASQQGSEHFITGNKNANECPICPTTQVCPSSALGVFLCWNAQHCQKLCPRCKQGQACMDDGTCCDENCLGGCNGTGPTNCIACQGVLFQGECITNCPVKTYEFLERRCVIERECYDMPKPREIMNEEIRARPWKPFKNQCLLECPPNYVEVKVVKTDGLIKGRNYYRCEPCKGPCKKECEGASVDSISSAQRLRGCTYIKGSLEIQIRGGINVVKELEDSLNMIEEIHGYLKIVRSFPLVSLNFLKKLRIIHGESLESGKFALVVLDNQNLVELWDFQTRGVPLEIKKGRLFFHFNPKLCLYKIENLRDHVHLPEFTEMEVARNSNGDKVSCNMSILEAIVAKKSSEAVLIQWKQFDHYDSRTLLGYIIYYIEAPYQNVTMYDGRDACGGDGWKVDDISPQDTTGGSHINGTMSNPTAILTRLKPYTQYAYYIKTYTIATEKSGAQSPIQYFRTEPDTPSRPQYLKAYSNSSSELVITWLPPLHPNGNVTHYVIQGTCEKDDSKFLEQRNYCTEPLNPADVNAQPGVKTVLTDDDDIGPGKSEDCSCKDNNQKIKKRKEKEIQFQIHFEDTLHNQVYIKRSSREKREISPLRDGKSITENHFTESDPRIKMVTLSSNGVLSIKILDDTDCIPFEYIVYSLNSFVIRNLRHFAQYTIGVQACRERDEDENVTESNNCSNQAIVSARTLKHAPADTITGVRFNVIESSNQSYGIVKIYWDEPTAPNGLIVNYQISYRLADIDNAKTIVECITRRQFKDEGKSFTLQNLSPGNYSFQIRATSLAGSGNYTTLQYFQIEGPPAVSNFQIAVCTLIAGLVIILCIMVLYLRRQSKRTKKLIAEVNPEYMSTAYEPDEWEVPRRQIELLSELGQGSFGMVYQGVARNVVPNEPIKRCAVKTVNENASDRERMEFLNEASVMKSFNTFHVVKLLGVVSQGQPTLVVMELMANGDLKTYLRAHRFDETNDPDIQPPTLKRVLQMAVEIADGMAYLTAKKFVHRDLAARNCMVAEDLTVKIGDFGMTRDIYETDYYKKGTKGLLPVRWMAPESLKDGVFTSFSDVWSYGIVLWEMATLASQPYQGLTNDQVLRYVIDGGVIERPDNCPDKLYHIMRLCWQHKPKARPSFLNLVTGLLSDSGPNFANRSFYYSDVGLELRSMSSSVGTTNVGPTLVGPIRVSSTPFDCDDTTRFGSTSDGTTRVATTSDGASSVGTASVATTNVGTTRVGATSVATTSAGASSVNNSRVGAAAPEEETPLCISREVEDFSLSDDEDYNPPQQPQSSSSSKVSNGSTTPTPTPNGYIVRHNGNSIKTTKC